MPDGWEFAYGLDPTDPFDGSRDNDADGVSIGLGIGFGFDRYWSNLEEYRFTAPSEYGHNGTIQVSDTDGDGLTDGEEYWGWFPEPIILNALSQSTISLRFCAWSICIDVHMGELDWADPVVGVICPLIRQPRHGWRWDADGWEISLGMDRGRIYRGNEWTLDPNNPDDANEDADGDGLTNLCEYEWGRLREDRCLEYNLMVSLPIQC